MLTLQKSDYSAALSISTCESQVDDLLSEEWLLTNGRGSYSSSTVIGCNTRRYHGLLIGSLRPPVKRVMALANCMEMVISKGHVLNLTTFEFDDKLSPEGYGFLKRFRKDVGAHFDYELDKVDLTRSVYLLRDKDMIAVVYDFINVREEVDFISRPFVGLRDFHELQKSYAPLISENLGNGVLVRYDTPDKCELFINSSSAHFEKDRQWWFNFVYRTDKERGQDFCEDLWTPGFFKCRITSPGKVVLWASLLSAADRRKQDFDKYENDDIDTIIDDLQKHRETLRKKVKNVKRDSLILLSQPQPNQSRWTKLKIENWELYETLYLAGDDFITKRASNGDYRTTILAGYPWFADWGRDAFISLPGLLLLTGRHEEARSVLTTFAAAADAGMIPNRFDDREGTTYFNSVDASLWFVNAAFQYLYATEDMKTFMQELMPTIRWITDSYYKGTRFDIHAEEDGLISAGNFETQLTWMDAKYGGVAFTPRFGKAVEVNALWYNCLCMLARFYSDRDIKVAEYYDSLGEKVRDSFQHLFWNENNGYLNDCILPDFEGSRVDQSLRPNQIFAVSLPYTPLSLEQQKSVVNAVRTRLLTPYGLRSLDPSSARYKGKYTGPQQQRDEAYHQGTVWPYLIGPFVEAFLKVNEFSKNSKNEAAEFIEPLLRHLTTDGCLGSVSEIFDGDSPQLPKGCFAQAWSVAELMRAYLLINS